jgi:hypothetical protein
MARSQAKVLLSQPTLTKPLVRGLACTTLMEHATVPAW